MKFLVQWKIQGRAMIGKTPARTQHPTEANSGPFYLAGDEIEADLSEVADLVSTRDGGAVKGAAPLIPDA